MSESTKLWNTIVQSKAIVEAHFYYDSNYHTPYYVDTDLFFEDPARVERVAAIMYKNLRIQGKIDYVVTPNYRGGFLLAHHIAERLNSPVVLSRRRKGIITLPPDRDIKGKVVIVDDGLNTGNSIKRLLEALTRTGASVVGIGVFIERYVGDLNNFHGLVKPIISVPPDYRLIDRRITPCELCEEYKKTLRKLEEEGEDRVSKEDYAKKEKLEPKCAYGDSEWG